MKKGDLVHIPSNVLLVDKFLAPGKYRFTTKPEVGIFIESGDELKYCRAFVLGKVWRIERECMFEFATGGKDVGEISRSKMGNNNK
jgi:hypothetical protein